MEIWFLIVAAGIATLAIRVSFFFLQEKVKLPEWMQQAQKFIPIAVISALVFSNLVYRGGKLDISTGNEQLLAGLLALLVAATTRSTLLTVCAGLIGLFFLRWLG